MGISWEQMMEGMGLITKQGKEWPPSAPEFRALCEGEKSSDTWQQRAYKAADDRDQKRLPQKRDPEIVSKGSQMIAELRKGLA